MLPYIKLTLLASLMVLCSSQSMPSKIVDGNNELALNLMHELSGETDNLFFSPLSISTSLHMLLSGAGGKTKEELRKVLAIDENVKMEDINKELKMVMENINKADNNVMVKMANRVLVNQNSPLNKNYRQMMANVYKSSIDSVNFAKDSEKITNEVNKWVNNQTNGKIEKLFDSPIDNDASVVLANAIYFNGKWKHAFDEKQTMPDDFYNLGSMEPIQTDMMNVVNQFKFISLPQLNARVIEVPFAGDNISMIIVLPNQINGLNSVTENFTPEVLNEAVSMLRNPKLHQSYSDVSLKMPKFKLNTDYKLKEPLEQLELSTLFNNGADLSGINGKGNLMVSSIIHKAFIDVNELSAEAAAATGVQVTSYSLRTPEEFKVDRPFMFLIRDNRNGLILFLGHIKTVVDEDMLGIRGLFLV